jgi:hypothetical protein
MTATQRSPWLRRLRSIAIVIALVAALLAALFIGVTPTVEARTRPTAQDVAAAHALWSQLSATRALDEPARIRIDSEAISGLSALASDATGKARFEGELEQGVLAGRAIISLPLGLWLNAAATVSGRHSGFPAYHLKIGRVSFPPMAARWVAELGRWVLRFKGADIPPLDSIVSRVSINEHDLLAVLALPNNSGMVGGLISASGTSLDNPLVGAIYCRMASAQRTDPARTLPELVRRAFDKAHAAESEAYSRAALVALSLFVVGDQAESLAPKAAALTKACPRPGDAVLLQQREDLAKHWAFSAGLTAVLGGEASASLGEWKELHDSLPDGTGFSFVDLAADRSGVQTALRALDPLTAGKTIAELRRATDDVLLPQALLHSPEGLSDASFVGRYGGLDRERYREAVVAIDRTLAGSRAAR